MFFFDDIGPIETQDLPVSDLWSFLPVGYLVTILIETPMLLVGLTRKLSLRQRALCGVWLTACTYPIVVLVLPTLFYGQSRLLYLAVAETFAPVAECVLFWLAFRGRDLLTGDWARSFAAIVAANLASFGLGQVLHAYGWFGLF
jgi:hypothetical protein